MGQPNLSSSSPRRTTAIFAKCPRPGRVKTRLCPTLDPQQAAKLAEAMLEDLVERLSPWDSFHTALCYAPPEERAWFAGHFPILDDLRVQTGNGLAQRLLHFFRAELAASGAGSAVAIGSDAPLLAPQLIARAHESLHAGADLVLGPDLGGGYYLIGMKRALDALFLDVEMSTGDMYAHTLRIARSLELKVEQLEPLSDVDVAEDLVRLREALAALEVGDEGYPHRTAAFLERLSTEEA